MEGGDENYQFVVSRLTSGQSISQIADELAASGIPDPITHVYLALTEFFIKEAMTTGIPFEEFAPQFMQLFGLSPTVQIYLYDVLIGAYDHLKSPPFPSLYVLNIMSLQPLMVVLGGAGVQGFIATMTEEDGHELADAMGLLFRNLSNMILQADPQYEPFIQMIAEYIMHMLDVWPDKTLKGIKEFFKRTLGISDESASYFRLSFMLAFTKLLSPLGAAGAEAFLRARGYNSQIITELFKHMSPTYAGIMSSNAPFANRSIEELLARVPANAPNAALARNILQHKYRNLEESRRQAEAKRMYAANINRAEGGAEAAVRARHPTITNAQARNVAKRRENTGAPRYPQYIHAEWTPAANALSPVAPRHFPNRDPPMGIMFEEGHPNYRVSWANEQPSTNQKKRSRRNIASKRKRRRTRGNSNNNNNNNNNNSSSNNNAQNVNNI